MSESLFHLSKLLSLTDILDNIDAGIIIYDAYGNFKFMNKVMINWRNIPRNEYVKMNVHDFSKVLDICVFDLVIKFKKKISRLQYYRDYQHPTAEEKIRLVTGTPIFDEQGNIQYVITLLQDIQQFHDQYQSLLSEHKVLPGPREGGRKEQPQLIAESPEMKQVLSAVANIASLDSTILIYGESGTGKEVLAKYIHEHSTRSQKPMITINCAAISENLIEAELFGYERGSFTGANKEGKIGLAEAANQGVLFLDEVNSLPFAVQGKVLRLLEEKQIRRIGAVKDKRVDIKIIAATNRNLAEMVKAGTFREDLYYRLNVIPITIPPLRNRKKDIIPLCRYFLNYFCTKYSVKKCFSDTILHTIENYSWPGNIRQIRNFVERAVVMTPSSIRIITDIPLEILGDQNSLYSTDNISSKSLKKHDKISKNDLILALSKFNQHRENTANYLGISRRTLQYLIKKYQLSNKCTYK